MSKHGSTKVLKRADSGGADDWTIIRSPAGEYVASLSSLVPAIRCRDLFVPPPPHTALGKSDDDDLSEDALSTQTPSSADPATPRAREPAMAAAATPEPEAESQQAAAAGGSHGAAPSAPEPDQAPADQQADQAPADQQAEQAAEGTKAEGQDALPASAEAAAMEPAAACSSPPAPPARPLTEQWPAAGGAKAGGFAKASAASNLDQLLRPLAKAKAKAFHF